IVTITSLIMLLFGAYLFWRYRHWSAILYLVCNMFIAVLVTLSLFPVFGYPLTVVSILALPIVLVLSLSDAIHLLGSLAKGLSSAAALRKLWIPSLLSSFTTAIAFFSFEFNEAPNMVQLGRITGTAVIFEFLVSMALAILFLKRIRLTQKEPSLTVSLSRFFERFKREWGLALLAMVLVAIGLLPMLRFEASTDDFFPTGAAVTKEHAYFRSQFDAQKVLYVWFEPKSGHAADPKAYQKWLNNQHPALYLHNELQAPEANDIQRATMYFKDVSAIPIYYQKLKQSGALSQARFKVHVYSPFIVFDVVNKQVASSLFWSLLTASSTIVLIMLWLTKNPLQALLGFLPNLVPLAAVVLYFVGANQGLNMLTALTLVVCIGLLDDDTIHVLYQKYILKAPVAEMNPIIIHAAILLAIGFGCFVVSNFEPTRIFGAVSALVFVIGLLGELTLFQWILSLFKQEKHAN
ncbi:MAG: hypothetical protein RLZZ301_697, partial [Bacteroidota bacterium]